MDPNCRATEFIGYARRRDIHLALLKHLRLGEIRFLVSTEVELKPLFEVPIVNGASLLVADREHFCVERRLAEPLFEDPRGVQKLVRNDRIVHSHAPLIEIAHDGLFLFESVGKLSAYFLACAGNFEVRKAPHVGRVVFDFARF